MNWQTFFTRTGTAIVFAIVMLAGLLGPRVLFLALFVLIQYLAIKEFFGLMKKINPNTGFGTYLQFFVQVIAFVIVVAVDGDYLTGFVLNQSMLLPVLACLPLTLLLGTWLGSKTDLNSGAYAIIALVYICVPMSMLMVMHHKSFIIPLGLILLIWINDTMAYIVGSFIGKTPFSKISPKKTWEGTIGGALLTVVAAGIWGMYSPYYSIQDWVALSLCASVAGTLGDLLESKLKRSADVKDSGSFMPGHGGALDRFDSLLVATPFAFAYCTIFMEPISIHLF